LPPYVAEIVTEVENRTVDVFTVKVALVAPAATVTLEGTLAAPVLLLESMICAAPNRSTTELICVRPTRNPALARNVPIFPIRLYSHVLLTHGHAGELQHF
jgi:hypothetical protein